MSSATYIAGLDLGQQTDRTALVVLEQYRPGADRSPRPRDLPEVAYRARHIDRFPTGRAYTDMVQDVEALLRQEPLRGRTTLVVDATGVGRAVADLFAGLGRRTINVTITGGQDASRTGQDFTVAKKLLASTTQALLQTGRLQFSSRVPETGVLLSELKDFRVKVSASGHARFEHRSGAHDDLVLACALAAWYAERGSRRRKAFRGILNID